MEVGIDVNIEGFKQFGTTLKEVNKQLAKFATQLRIYASRDIPNVKKMLWNLQKN